MVLEDLDRRHAGHDMFKCRVRVTGLSEERMDQFHAIRVWCWENFGPSTERDTYAHIQPNSPWAWHIDPNRYIPYIYLRTDKEEMLFKLKWM